MQVLSKPCELKYIYLKILHNMNLIPFTQSNNLYIQLLHCKVTDCKLKAMFTAELTGMFLFYYL
jgi:hypothetical protein